MVLQNAVNNLITPQATNRVYGVVKRQAIAQGRLDSSGLPNSITINSGLSVTINAATAPLRVNFAAGFDTLGVAIDFCGIFNIDLIFSGLPINTTHYFYLERDSLTGLVIATRIAIAPVYARIAPTAPVTGLHWFKTSEDSLTSQLGMTMYEWSGSVWVARQRVFLGEVTTGASAVTSIANYAYNRRYQSAWTAFSAATGINFNHNLGMTLAEAEATFSGYGRANASDATATLIQMIWRDEPAAVYRGALPSGGTRLSITFTVYASLYANPSHITSGQMQTLFNSNW